MEIRLKNNERLDDLQFNNLHIIQEKDGYCFTSDAVMLANFVHMPKGRKLVDLCSGSGVIGILAGEKNQVSKAILVELQDKMADMCKRTLDYNGLKNYEIINLPLQGISQIIGSGIYDAVVCNPPYKKIGTAKLINENESIAIARHEIKVTLEEIILEASKLLKFGGDFYLVNKEERLTDIFVLCRKFGLEPKILKIRASSSGANIILVKAKKGGKSGITISLEE